MFDSSLKNARILIVDDQEANIDILESFLEMQGYTELRSVTDPREVSGLLTDYRPDLILLDLMMPYLSGYEVLSQMQAVVPAHSFLPVLVLTADISPEAKVRALSEGAKDFLLKPFDLIEVDLRIRNLLQTRYLYLQNEERNQRLEEKVQERTEELRQLNQALMVAKEQAEAGDRMKTAFMQNISHEIRTPLNGILGFSSLLVDTDLSLEQKQDYYAMLQDSCDRLVNTITDYLDVSLLLTGNMPVLLQEVILWESIQSTLIKFESRFKAKGLQFSLQIAPESRHASLRTDPKLLNKILDCLLDNALKFTPSGSVELGWSQEQQSLSFYVKDTGVGIGKEFIAKIFSSFQQEDYSANRLHEGSGLGLTLTRGMLALLGGSIRVESEKGKGSTFFFTLPLTTE